MSSRFGRFFLQVLPIALFAAILVLAIGYLLNDLRKEISRPTVRVLSYSGFVNSWGPGPEIAMKFFEATGMNVELHDGGDAGLLLKKLDLFPADVVIGFDQANLPEAEATRAWRDINPGNALGAPWSKGRFVAFDWSPMAFIYRQGEVEPPRSLGDLTDERFRGSIVLQDPRTSTPGLQFLLWVLDEMGMDEGFEFLKRLKPNIHSVSSGWSTAYGIFKKGQAKLAFSYLTSPTYHWLEEKDRRYQAATFSSGHPVQIEFVAVPESCENCEGAEGFARFLLKPEIQEFIMNRNFMFPVVESAKAGEFLKLPSVRTLDPDLQIELMRKKNEIFARWRDLGI